MHAPQHSTVREGLATGLLGAAVVALWYIVWDFATGHPLHTFSVLGRILLQGDVNPGLRTLDPAAAAGFLVLHLAIFIALGMALAALAHLASRNPAMRMGVWIGLVVGFCFLTGITFMLTVSTGDRLPLAEVVIGGLLGIAAMAWLLWRHHPRLRRSFDEVPLGDEVRTPGHAPGGPRA
jgi:hypothetical protein